MVKNSYLKQNTQMYPTHVNIRIAVISSVQPPAHQFKATRKLSGFSLST